MNIFKSHFWYSKSQRNGIFLFILIILVLQLVYHFVDFNPQKINTDSAQVLAFQKQIDSVKEVEANNRKPKIYPFNPNFISDYKGEQLGMSLLEIDKLHRFRAKDKFVNSAKEFQKVTGVSDSLLKAISVYFKFPDWVVAKNNQRQKKKEIYNITVEKKNQPVSTTDINLATASDFQTITGVSKDLSERIITYREKLQGFTYSDQLFEVWNMDSFTGNSILKTFSVQNKPTIQKINVNTATFKEVLSIPYINYNLCKKIFDYRDEVAELQSISELKNIKDFPLELYNRIVLYLLAK